MDDNIVRIAQFTPENVDQGCECPCGSEDSENYMFFRNLITMKDHIEKILQMDPRMIDELITNGHDWANDHIAAAAENITQVNDWLISECGD